MLLTYYMLQHNLKIALRSFLKDKSFSISNVLGLALAISAFFLAIQFASFEMSYDQFHDNKNNIFRVAHFDQDGEQSYEGVGSYFGIGPKGLEVIPEIQDFTRLHRADGMITWISDTHEPVSFYETQAYYADESFFQTFTFPLIKGQKGSALKDPNSVYISTSAAKKYFGDGDPLGQTLKLSTEWQGGIYTVEGVFEEAPLNSHLTFDFIFPITDLLTNFQFNHKDWYWINFYTYFVLAPTADIHDVSKRLSTAVEEHVKYNFQTPDYSFKLELQPLTEINLYSGLSGEIKETGKWKKIRSFIAAAFFTIILAWLNYINLATARASKRAKEIGLKKTFGSSKMDLIIQFIIESLFTNGIALFVASILLIILSPSISHMYGITIHFDWQSQSSYWILFAGLFLLGTLISSFYPAYYLSSLKVVATLKGQVSEKQSSSHLRKIMMTLQFCLSLLLLSGTIIIYQQIDLIMTKELGMNINNKLVIKAPRETKKGYWLSLNNFKDKVCQYPGISKATISFEVPGRPLFWGAGFNVKGGNTNVIVSRNSVDHHFIPTYEIEILAGRNFADRFEGQTAILNEQAYKALGFKSPEEAIDQKINDGWVDRRIIGVVKDYHQETAKHRVRPLVMTPFSKEQGYLTLDLSGDNRPRAIETSRKLYEELFPGNAFEYFFLEDYFAHQYESDEQFRNLLSTFTGLSLVIALLGLVGFSSFVSHVRTREVGIRKVLGASRWSILMLFNSEIGKLVLLSFLLTTPTIYFIAENWLKEYAIRLHLNLFHFGLPMTLILVLASLTFSSHLLRLSNANPVKLINRE